MKNTTIFLAKEKPYQQFISETKKFVFKKINNIYVYIYIYNLAKSKLKKKATPCEAWKPLVNQ